MKTAIDFASLQADGYKNINCLVQIRDRLHISETLFGDLGAKVMILGQDGAPFNKIKKLVDLEGPDGYRHGPDVKTNLNLVECLRPYISRQTNNNSVIPAKSCGVFYANAVWLLKETEGMAGALPNLKGVLNVCQIVLEETVRGLPQLEVIIALGAAAYKSLTLQSPKLNSNWKDMVASRKVDEIELFGKKVKVATVNHPSPLSGGKNLTKLKEDFDEILIRARLS